MIRAALLMVLLAGCGRQPDSADSADAALPAIDTLKAVTTSDTLEGVTISDTLKNVTTSGPRKGVTTPDTLQVAGKSRTPPVPARARDSAFRPRRLPTLDTVTTRRPPR